MLNKLTNVLLCIACFVTILSGSRYGYRSYEMYKANRSVPRVSAGQTLTVKEALGRPTLLMELSSSCPHCIANEPAYRQLKDLPQIRDGRVQVVVAMLAPNYGDAENFVQRDQIPVRLST